MPIVYMNDPELPALPHHISRRHADMIAWYSQTNTPER
jgi:hypothetical protein